MSLSSFYYKKFYKEFYKEFHRFWQICVILPNSLVNLFCAHLKSSRSNKSEHKFTSAANDERKKMIKNNNGWNKDEIFMTFC